MLNNTQIEACSVFVPCLLGLKKGKCKGFHCKLTYLLYLLFFWSLASNVSYNIRKSYVSKINFCVPFLYITIKKTTGSCNKDGFITPEEYYAS